MRLIDPNKRELEIREDYEIDGYSFARIKAHINNADRIDMEKALAHLAKLRNMAFYRQNDARYSNTQLYYNGQYTAFHKAHELIKRALEGKEHGK